MSLLGGIFSNLAFGMLYSWGSISVYVRQYFNREMGTNMSQDFVNYIFPLQFLALFLGNLFGVPFKEQIGSRVFVGSCGVGMMCSIVIAAMAKNFYLFGFFYGICLAFFCGVAYVPVLSTQFAYFPNNQGIISGILMMAYGFSAVIIQTMVMYLINPDSLPKDKVTGLFPDEVLDRLPESLKIVAVYLLIICLLGAVLMKSKKVP